MTSRLDPYRVQAYNPPNCPRTRCTTIPSRNGSVSAGGWCRGVDVMAYMMHLPVKKWGRAFLERGLIEARFVKPVYDGETVNITGGENDGVLSIEVESRGELCATGTATLPASAPSFSLADFAATAPVAERKPVSVASYQPGQWLGTVPRAWAGDEALEYLTDIRERDPIYAREGLGHPGCCSG